VVNEIFLLGKIVEGVRCLDITLIIYKECTKLQELQASFR